MLNGLYLTTSDFPEWQDEFTKLVTSNDKLIYSKTKNSNIRAKSITFVVTENCNLNCTYCYQKNKTKRRMTKKVAKQAIDMIFDEKLINGYYDFEYSKGVILDFIGGEPLLEIDLMDYIVDYFKIKAFNLNHPWALNYMISISSNGILYDTDKVQKFLNKNKGKTSMSITIDGNKELHDKCRLFPDGKGSYDIVEKSVKKLLQQSNEYGTKITLCPENVKYLNAAIKNVWDLGLKCAYTNCVFEKGWTVEDAKVLYNEMKKLADYILDNDIYTENLCTLFDETIGQKLIEKGNWCGGNGDMLAIAPDGKCYPCIRFMKYCLSNPNREEQPIGDIWNGLDSKKNNPWLLKLCSIDMDSQCQHEDNKKCLTCPIASGCALCTGYNYDYYGDANHKATFICDTHKARVLANVYFWNKLYKKLNINKHFDCNLDKKNCLTIIDEKEYNYLISL